MNYFGKINLKRGTTSDWGSTPITTEGLKFTNRLGSTNPNNGKVDSELSQFGVQIFNGSDAMNSNSVVGMWHHESFKNYGAIPPGVYKAYCGDEWIKNFLIYFVPHKFLLDRNIEPNFIGWSSIKDNLAEFIGLSDTVMLTDPDGYDLVFVYKNNITAGALVSTGGLELYRTEVLAPGQPGVEYTSHGTKLKIGPLSSRGLTPWENIPYITTNPVFYDDTLRLINFQGVNTYETTIGNTEIEFKKTDSTGMVLRPVVINDTGISFYGFKLSLGGSEADIGPLFTANAFKADKALVTPVLQIVNTANTDTSHRLTLSYGKEEQGTYTVHTSTLGCREMSKGKNLNMLKVDTTVDNMWDTVSTAIYSPDADYSSVGKSDKAFYEGYFNHLYNTALYVSEIWPSESHPPIVYGGLKIDTPFSKLGFTPTPSTVKIVAHNGGVSEDYQTSYIEMAYEQCVRHSDTGSTPFGVTTIRSDGKLNLQSDEVIFRATDKQEYVNSKTKVGYLKFYLDKTNSSGTTSGNVVRAHLVPQNNTGGITYMNLGSYLNPWSHTYSRMLFMPVNDGTGVTDDAKVRGGFIRSISGDDCLRMNADEVNDNEFDNAGIEIGISTDTSGDTYNDGLIKYNDDNTLPKLHIECTELWDQRNSTDKTRALIVIPGNRDTRCCGTGNNRDTLDVKHPLYLGFHRNAHKIKSTSNTLSKPELYKYFIRNTYTYYVAVGKSIYPYRAWTDNNSTTLHPSNETEVCCGTSSQRWDGMFTVNFSATGTITTVNPIASASDKRVKTSIKYLDGKSPVITRTQIYEFVKNLRPATFKIKSGNPGVSTSKLPYQLGFIAQDMYALDEKVFNSVGQVLECEKDSVYTDGKAFALKDLPMTSAALVAVQELMRENDELRARLDAIEKKLASLL